MVTDGIVPIEPLTPPDADLRGYPFTPLFRARLFGSRFHARASDAEWRAGVTLWLKSWDQTPAGSLPDDDIDLCRLAELGRDLKQWKKVKAGALHGWAKATDGRLYHEVVAEGINEALGKKLRHSKRGTKGAAARWLNHNSSMQEARAGGAQSMVNASGSHALSIPQAMLADGNRDGDGDGERERKQAARVRGRANGNGMSGPRRWPEDSAIEPCGLDPTKPADHPDNIRDRDRPTVRGSFLDYTFERAMELAGMDPAKSAATWQPVVVWLKDDIGTDAIFDAIRRCAARPGYEPPRTLQWFDRAVREQRA